MDDIFQKLNNRAFFKLILGLGYTSYEDIKRISAVYALAGVDMFDMSPDAGVINAVEEGIKSVSLNPSDFSMCVSYSVSDDKHGRKAFINQKKCSKCKKCIKKCPYSAIEFNKEVKVNPLKCIGCGKCSCSAIKYKKEETDILQSLNNLKDYSIDCLELHISTTKIKKTEQIFGKIKKEFPDIPVSVCISREKFSEEKLLKLLSKLIEMNNPIKLIIQADGLTMNGGEDTYNSTLQAVAAAQVMKDLNAFIILSGGTNSKTIELAKLCDIEINGIAIGSYGRLLIDSEVKNTEFWYNNDVFSSALNKAKSLVELVKK